MKCLIWNINNFCGNKKTRKNGGTSSSEIANAIKAIIDIADADVVALQEFPINLPTGEKFIEEMENSGYNVHHYECDPQKKGYSIPVTFTKKGIIANVSDLPCDFDKNLRLILVNINGIDHLNVHCPTDTDTTDADFMESLYEYTTKKDGFIYGDFNNGLYIEKKVPIKYEQYKKLLSGGYRDILAIPREKVKYAFDNPIDHILAVLEEQVTSAFDTPIDHILAKEGTFTECKVIPLKDYSDHFPLILNY